MGTRNLTAVFVDGQYKVAQYGQWDGYPSVQGLTALKFARRLRSDKNRAKFLKNVRSATFLKSDDFIQSEWERLGDSFTSIYPYVSRDHGAGILEMIFNAKKPPLLRNQLEFAGDSLYCEWGYVLDLDKNVLEVYKGFNQKPLPKNARFKDITEKKKGFTGEYYPVRLVHSFDLANLPTKKEFLKILEPEEDE